MDLGSSTDLDESYDAPVGSGVGCGGVSAQHSDIGNGVSGTEEGQESIADLLCGLPLGGNVAEICALRL